MDHLPDHIIKKDNKIIRNPHFWAVALITAFLIFFYYLGHFTHDTWFTWPEQPLSYFFYHEMYQRLFLVPVLYSGIIFRRRGAIYAWLAFIIAVLPVVCYFTSYPEFIAASTLIFAFIILGSGFLAAIYCNRMDSERETFARLEESRQSYLTGILKAQENERQRIAHDIHDDTMQSLLVAANRIHGLASAQNGELCQDSRREMAEVRDSLFDIIEGLRRQSQGLRPSILDSIGLLAAVRWLVEDLCKENTIDAEVIVHGTERRLHPEAEVIIFRIVQEALNNIRRHSGATEASVTLDFAPRDLKVVVSDNGTGFRVPASVSELAVEGKLGLNGMRQRAKLIDASFDIRSAPGQGTIVSVEAQFERQTKR